MEELICHGQILVSLSAGADRATAREVFSFLQCEIGPIQALSRHLKMNPPINSIIILMIKNYRFCLLKLKLGQPPPPIFISAGAIVPPGPPAPLPLVQVHALPLSSPLYLPFSPFPFSFPFYFFLTLILFSLLLFSHLFLFSLLLFLSCIHSFLSPLLLSFPSLSLSLVPSFTFS